MDLFPEFFFFILLSSQIPIYNLSQHKAHHKLNMKSNRNRLNIYFFPGLHQKMRSPLRSCFYDYYCMVVKTNCLEFNFVNQLLSVPQNWKLICFYNNHANQEWRISWKLQNIKQHLSHKIAKWRYPWNIKSWNIPNIIFRAQ